MRLAYLCFVSNGLDDHFMKLVCSCMSAKEFLLNVEREYWKCSTGLKDAVGAYSLAVDLDCLRVKALGLSKIEKDGKLYPRIGRGKYSGRPESPEELEQRAELMMNEN